MTDFYGCQTVGDLLPRQCATRSESVATIFRGRITSYSQLDEHANQVAHGLIASSIRAGDRIAYIGKNSDFAFELLFGAAKGNVVLVPLSWRLAAPEIAAILRDADINMLFVGEGAAELVASMESLPPGNVIGMDIAPTAWLDFASWRDRYPIHDPCVATAPDDTALQLYTSGTTGLPKGVELSHANLMALLHHYESADVVRLSGDEVGLVCMPFSHIAGCGVGLLCLAQGARTIILAEVTIPGIVEAFERHQPSFAMFVPAVILMVVQYAEANSLRWARLQRLVYGASPIAEDLVLRAMKVFPCAGFHQVYGATEGTAVATFSTPDAHEPTRGKLRSCGKPYPGIGLRVVDAFGNVVPAGEVGEIVLKGPFVMKGYWKNPEATRAAFFDDGWLRSGDAGYFDEDGFLYIYDRVKDMIVTGAENVYPAEVENALFGHPAIADVAVIGVPDPRWGEAVKAIVVLSPGAAADPLEIISYARTRIAGFKLPKSVDFVDALPRTASGKVMRRELRAPYWQGRSRGVG